MRSEKKTDLVETPAVLAVFAPLNLHVKAARESRKEEDACASLLLRQWRCLQNCQGLIMFPTQCWRSPWVCWSGSAAHVTEAQRDEKRMLRHRWAEISTRRAQTRLIHCSELHPGEVSQLITGLITGLNVGRHRNTWINPQGFTRNDQEPGIEPRIVKY